jgi:hypothetical protein
MSVTLNKADATPVLRRLEAYFKDMLADLPDAKSVNDFHERGVPKRPADDFLWNIDTDKLTYTKDEISEIKEQVKLIRNDETMGGYPLDIQDAAKEFFLLLRPMHGGKNKRTRKNKTRKTRKVSRKH